MERKRKDGCSNCVDEIWAVDHDDGDDPRMVVIDRNEMMKLTKVARSWEFTCSFCFKKFPSAQAMGGHQNAHRNERLEEKRLFVRDPIGYRKRAFLRAIKTDESSSAAAAAAAPAIEGGSSSFKYVHAASEMVRNETAGFNGGDPLKRRGGMTAAAAAGCFYQRWSCKESSSSSVNGEIVVMNMYSGSKLLAPKELSLVESVGDYEKEKACNDINLDHNLDLTLKL